MNKYVTNVTMEENCSITYIVNQVKPGARVLEFGPATGYMTKYMKEVLKCEVYIVEIDEEAYDNARVYSKGGLCGNIEDYEWVELFADLKFDYITFSDVLEHLTDPWRVLKVASKFLKEDGRVLISIPNIAHNAVLIDLFNNKFEYRRTGILDNTHLRFFTHDSVVRMFEQSDLEVEEEDAVIFGLEYAGLENSEKDIHPDIWKALQLRKYGFVNQFLFTLRRKQENTTVDAVIASKPMLSLEAVLYYSERNGYDESRKVIGMISFDGNDFKMSFAIPEGVNIDRIRIDLINSSGFIRNLKINSNAEILNISAIGGEIKDDVYYFYEGKTGLEIEYAQGENIEQIEISGEFFLLTQEDLVKHIQQAEAEMLAKTGELEQRLCKLNEEKEHVLRIITEREQAYDTQLRQLENGYDTQLRQLETGFDAQLRQLETGYDTRLRQLETDHDTQIRQLENGYDVQLRQLQSGYDNQLKQLEAEHGDKEKQLTVEYNNMLKKLENEKNLLVMQREGEIQEHKKQLADCRKELAMTNEFLAKIFDNWWFKTFGKEIYKSFQSMKENENKD